MPAKRSFWNAVESIRYVRRARAQLALSRAREALTRAQVALAGAAAALQAQQALAPRGPSEASGDSALELQRCAAFSLRHVHSMHALRARWAQALREFTAREAALDEARRALERTRTEHQVLERHRLSIRRVRLRKRDACEQIEVEDQTAKPRAGRAN